MIVRQAISILERVGIRLIPLLFCFVITITYGQEYKTSYTIAQDGSGDYKTLQEALDVCKAFPDKRIIIKLKPGVYREKIEVHSWTTNISLVGEKPENTIISFDDYSGKGKINTFTSYTAKVLG